MAICSMVKMISNPQFAMLSVSNIQSRGHERSEVGVPRCAPVSSAPERHLPRTVIEKLLRSHIWEIITNFKNFQFRIFRNLGIYTTAFDLLVRYGFDFCFVDWVVFQNPGKTRRSWASCARLRQVGRSDHSSLGRDGLSKGEALYETWIQMIEQSLGDGWCWQFACLGIKLDVSSVWYSFPPPLSNIFCGLHCT